MPQFTGKKNRFTTVFLLLLKFEIEITINLSNHLLIGKFNFFFFGILLLGNKTHFDVISYIFLSQYFLYNNRLFQIVEFIFLDSFCCYSIFRKLSLFMFLFFFFWLVFLFSCGAKSKWGKKKWKKCILVTRYNFL